MRSLHTVLLLAIAAAGAAAQDQPPAASGAEELDGRRDSDARCRALAALQDRGALDVEAVLAAFGDADAAVAATAASIVRHEWTVLPAELLQALERAPTLARPLLRELAVAPRPSLRDWVQRALLRAADNLDDRCFWLAARGEPLTPADADVLLQTLLAGKADDGFHAAMTLLPAAVADALLGKLHAHLAQRALDAAQVLPLLDRLSPAGVRRLLGLVVTLPADLAEALCQHVVERDMAAFRERVAAALDGRIPLEPVWLRRAGPLLDSPARRERVLAVLAAADAGSVQKEAAFEALLDARVVDKALLDWVDDGADNRADKVRRLLDACCETLPETRLLAWLGDTPELSTATVASLARRSALGGPIEAVLRTHLAEAGHAEGVFGALAGSVLAQRGSEAAVDAIWPLLRTSPQFDALVDTLARRREPFVHELLLGELLAPVPDGIDEAVRQVQLDAVRLALVALGDRRELRVLVAHASDRAPSFVRRCAHHAGRVDTAAALALLDAAAAATDEDLAVELVGWASATEDPAVRARLAALWQRREPSELQAIALRALVLGATRAELVGELRQAMAAPLAERHETLCFELVATMPAELAAADVRLLADLALLLPLGDAERERANAARWPDGRFGFPLVAAVAQRLRGAPPALLAAGFEAAVGSVRAHPAREVLTRQRLLVLWRSLEADRIVQTAVGVATAQLLLDLPGASGLGEGPAHWFLMQAAAGRGEHGEAARHARAAIAGLLRLPSERRTARLFLGERDPAAGEDPWAALAAAPFLHGAGAALAGGAEAEAASAFAMVRELGGRDAAVAAAIPTNKEVLR